MKTNAKIVFLCLTLIFLLVLNFPAAAKGDNIIKLKPSENSEGVLDNVELILSDSKIGLKVEGTKKVDSGIDVFKIIIDKEKNEYKLEKVQDQKLKEYENLIKEKDIEQNNFSILSTSYSGGVIVTTTDPVDEPLCKTWHKIWWSVDYPYSTLTSRNKDTWAANPSFFNTHWYVDAEEWTGLSYIDGGRTVRSSMHSSFYNYDFNDPNARTDVDHYITLEGRNSGYFGYEGLWYWTWSGDMADLLITTLATY